MFLKVWVLKAGGCTNHPGCAWAGPAFGHPAYTHGSSCLPGHVPGLGLQRQSNLTEPMVSRERKTRQHMMVIQSCNSAATLGIEVGIWHASGLAPQSAKYSMRKIHFLEAD